MCVQYKNPDGKVERVVPEQIFQILLNAALQTVEVDEEWYMTNYEDVAKACRDKGIANAKEHYVKFGYFEGRLPRRLEFDESYYLSVNPDVAVAVENNEIASGIDHFEKVGHKEGRRPTERFSLF
ncbi:hypothetical protein [Methylosinus sporium]|uniref:hypothetical protein n=1 Tax=Methylosinus sporium TaxID=428 RepID=UPI00383AE3D6